MLRPAEAYKGGLMIAENRLPRSCPPFPPFDFETVNVVARCCGASILIGFIGQGRQGCTIRGQGTFDPLPITIEKDDHVGLFIEDEPVVRQVIVHRDLFDMLPEPLDRTLRA